MEIEDKVFEIPELVEMGGEYYLLKETNLAKIELNNVRAETEIRRIKNDASWNEVREYFKNEIIPFQKKLEKDKRSTPQPPNSFSFHKSIFPLSHKDNQHVLKLIETAIGETSFNAFLEDNNNVEILNLLISWGNGSKVVKIFGEKLASIDAFIEKVNLAKIQILIQLSQRDQAEWVIENTNITELLKQQGILPEMHANLILTLFQTNQIDFLVDKISEAFGENGFENLFNKLEGKYFDKIIEIFVERFRTYSLFRILPKEIGNKFFEGRHSKFIEAIARLLDGGCFIRSRERFRILIDDNSRKSILILFNKIQKLESIYTNIDVKDVGRQDELVYTVEREYRLVLDESYGQIVTSKLDPDLFQFNPDVAYKLFPVEKLLFIREFNGHDIFLLKTSGSPIFVFRNIESGIVFSRQNVNSKQAILAINQLLIYADESIHDILQIDLDEQVIQEGFVGMTYSQFKSMLQKNNNLIDLIANDVSRILKHLEELGIHHGHPHNHNINVSFKIQIGDKSVKIFDPKIAKALAKQFGSKIELVVKIRDWDLSILIPKIMSEYL